MKKHQRPKATQSYTVREPTGCGNLYVTVGKDNEKVIEIFAVLGKGGSCITTHNEALTRAISLGLKYGIPLEEYIEELSGINCPGHVWSEGKQITSCADAIARVLKEEVQKEAK